MSNTDPYFDPELPDSSCDELLDRYFESVELPDVDTTGITMLTHKKVLQSDLVRSLRLWRILAMVAVAACIVLVFLIPGIQNGAAIQETSRQSEVIADAGSELMEIEVPIGRRMTVVLPDGSKLIANSRSRIRYPSHFTGDTRTIWTSGEVYFDVAKNPSCPFIVQGDGYSVKVYGTRFTVSDYGRGVADVVLVEGCVAVSTANDERVRMRPGHILSLRHGSIDEVRNVDTSYYTSWTDGALQLDNRTLGEIVGRLANYYDVDIEVASSLKGSRLYGRMDLKGDVRDILEALSTIIPMTVETAPDGSHYNLYLRK